VWLTPAHLKIRGHAFAAISPKSWVLMRLVAHPAPEKHVLVVMRSRAAGTVTTLAAPDQAAAVREAATELGLELGDLPEPGAPALAPGAAGGDGAPADVDAAKRGLEDIFHLF
jgi:hypothetical protein